MAGTCKESTFFFCGSCEPLRADKWVTILLNLFYKEQLLKASDVTSRKRASKQLREAIKLL